VLRPRASPLPHFDENRETSEIYLAEFAIKQLRRLVMVYPPNVSYERYERFGRASSADEIRWLINASIQLNVSRSNNQFRASPQSFVHPRGQLCRAL